MRIAFPLLSNDLEASEKTGLFVIAIHFVLALPLVPFLVTHILPAAVVFLPCTLAVVLAFVVTYCAIGRWRYRKDGFGATAFFLFWTWLVLFGAWRGLDLVLFWLFRCSGNNWCR